MYGEPFSTAEGGVEMTLQSLHWAISGLAAAGIALATPVMGLADEKTKGDERAGGTAAEHRSEQAGESSNAQWSDDATKGEERAADRRHQQPETPDKAKAKRSDAGSTKAAEPSKDKKSKTKGKTP
jgi:hypothetical protein